MRKKNLENSLIDILATNNQDSQANRKVIEMICDSYESWKLARAEVEKHGLLLETEYSKKANPACTLVKQYAELYARLIKELNLFPAKSMQEIKEEISELDSVLGD